MPDPKDEKKLTGDALTKAAAKFTGVKEDEIFEAFDKGNGRFAVVTVDGKKFTKTPDERAADEKAEAAAVAARQKAKLARAERRSSGK